MFLGRPLYSQSASSWRTVWVSCTDAKATPDCAAITSLYEAGATLLSLFDVWHGLMSSYHRNVVSYADGPASHSTGRLLFYLTKMDSAAYDTEVNATVSFAIAEASLEGACPRYDPEDPPCSKITVSGKLLRVPDADTDVAKVCI